MRAIMTSAYGVRCDVGWIISLLVDKGIYDDYTDPQVEHDIRTLGRKLALVGGRLAPVVVLLQLQQYMKPEYAAHVGELWGLDAIDEADLDPADVPTLDLVGVPPAQPGRRTANG